MFLQPHCLLWALEGRFHRVALMTTTEVVEQSAARRLAVLAPCTLQCSVPTPHRTHQPLNRSQRTQLSSKSWCLFNYWEQRGSLTNSFSQPLIAPSLAFLSSSLCHCLRLDFSLCLPLLSSPCSLSFTLLFSSPAGTICLTLPFHFYGLQSLSCHRHHVWTVPHRRRASLYLPRRIGSSIFDCCEILRRRHNKQASLNLMQYSEAMI